MVINLYYQSLTSKKAKYLHYAEDMPQLISTPMCDEFKGNLCRKEVRVYLFGNAI